MITRISSFACLAVTAVLASGCVLTIAPIIPASDAIFDERMLGRWEYVNGNAVALVSLADDSTYAISYTDSDGRSGAFAARLGRLGNHLVVDVWPDPDRDEDGPLEVALYVPAHLLLVLEIDDNEARNSKLLVDPLRQALQEGDVSLPYSEDEFNLILHGMTQDLFRELPRYLSGGGVLDRPETWRRANGG